jgi:hypothetical protein
MDYPEWKKAIFDHPPGTDPVRFEHPLEFYELPALIAFDYIDRVLIDPDVHTYTKEQIGIGLQTLFDNSCSNLPFLYVNDCDEPRRLTGIANLIHLYRHYFERYCTAPVTRIGYDVADGQIGYLCHMFWDLFVLYPGNATAPMQRAAINVMKSALTSPVDACLASAIHGLGHWVADVPEAARVLENWLRHPTTANREVLRYAREATTGGIL